MSEPFAECRKCGNKMVRISPVDSSPLIVECQRCGHREYAEVQIPPVWLPETGWPSIDATEADRTEKCFRFLDMSATPVSFGPADEETTVIPVGWLLLWAIVIALIGLLLWIVL
jgi:hypothetical protein